MRRWPAPSRWGIAYYDCMLTRWKPLALALLYAAAFAAFWQSAHSLFDGRLGEKFATIAALPVALMGTLFLYVLLRGLLDD